MEKSAFIVFIKKFFSSFIDILFPKICLACRSRINDDAVDNVVCLDCWGKITRTLPPFCARCGRGFPQASSGITVCRECSKNILCFDRAFSPCVYSGVIKELIHEFKYKNKEHLGRTLARIMVDFAN